MESELHEAFAMNIQQDGFWIVHVCLFSMVEYMLMQIRLQFVMDVSFAKIMASGHLGLAKVFGKGHWRLH